MIRACIFDLDGVIVDTAHYHFLAWQRLAAEIGIDLTVADNERLKGVSRMESLEIILALGKKTMTRGQMDQMANRKNTWFVEYVEAMKPDEIFPGVKELIGRMRSRSLRIGLASSSKNAQRVVELLGIAGLFDTIVDGTMITHTKPDPEIFLLAAMRLKIEPHDCLVFEDAEAGVEAALRAGMKCVGVGSPSQLGKAQRVITKTGDFKMDDISALAV